ncbi:MAG: hypothetical protein ABI968_15020, partial [Acidobacteriota bacterium]
MVATALLAVGLLPFAAGALTVKGAGIELEFDARLHSRVVAVVAGNRIEFGPFTASETVKTGRGERLDFALVDQVEEPFSDALGKGRRYRLTGRNADLEKLEKTVEIV